MVPDNSKVRGGGSVIRVRSGGIYLLEKGGGGGENVAGVPPNSGAHWEGGATHHGAAVLNTGTTRGW